MKIKISQATPLQIDWLAAKCEGRSDVYYCPPLKAMAWESTDVDEETALGAAIYQYHPSTDWAQGGPILTREHISRTIDHSGLWIAYWTDGYTDGDEGKKWMQCDRSELVAGLRCYVASKLGDEVEIPEELK